MRHGVLTQKSQGGYRAQEHDDGDATGSCSLVEATEKNRK